MKRYTLDGEPVNLDEFIAINTAPDVGSISDEEIAQARALKPGESMPFGGGAAAEAILTCEYDLDATAEEAREEPANPETASESQR